MRGNPGLEFIVLDFGTKRPRFESRHFDSRKR